MRTPAFLVLMLLALALAACESSPTTSSGIPAPRPTPTPIATPTLAPTPTPTPLPIPTPTATPTPTLTPTPTPSPTPTPTPTVQHPRLLQRPLPRPRRPLRRSRGRRSARARGSSASEIVPGVYEAANVSGTCEWARLSRLDGDSADVLFEGLDQSLLRPSPSCGPTQGSVRPRAVVGGRSGRLQPPAPTTYAHSHTHCTTRPSLDFRAPEHSDNAQ